MTMCRPIEDINGKPEYGSPAILPDATIVAKILITAAKLFNSTSAHSPSHELVDALATLRFYTSELVRRHSIEQAPLSRHNEYNSHFPVSTLLLPLDYAALILQKAIRIHHIFHTTNSIHRDSAADLLTYIHLTQNNISHDPARSH